MMSCVSKVNSNSVVNHRGGRNATLTRLKDACTSSAIRDLNAELAIEPRVKDE